MEKAALRAEKEDEVHWDLCTARSQVGKMLERPFTQNQKSFEVLKQKFEKLKKNHKL
jgi:hypothetical protein